MMSKIERLAIKQLVADNLRLSGEVEALRKANEALQAKVDQLEPIVDEARDWKQLDEAVCTVLRSPTKEPYFHCFPGTGPGRYAQELRWKTVLKMWRDITGCECDRRGGGKVGTEMNPSVYIPERFHRGDWGRK